VAGGLLAAAFAVFAARFFVLPDVSGVPPPQGLEIVGRVLDSFFVSLVAAIVLVVTIYLFGPIEGGGESSSIGTTLTRPSKIGATLSEMIWPTHEYWYRGHIGSYPRAVLVPELARHSREEIKDVDVYFLVIDPADQKTCQIYAKYRAGLPGGEKWTLQRVRQELLATILSCYSRKITDPQLRVHVGLLDEFTIFRVDLTARGALMTQISEKEEALRYDLESPAYASLRQDLRLSYEQARLLPDATEGVSEEDLDIPRTRKLLNDLQLSIELNDEAVLRVIELVRGKRNPYG